MNNNILYRQRAKYIKNTKIFSKRSHARLYFTVDQQTFSPKIFPCRFQTLIIEMMVRKKVNSYIIVFFLRSGTFISVYYNFTPIIRIHYFFPLSVFSNLEFVTRRQMSHPLIHVQQRYAIVGTVGEITTPSVQCARIRFSRANEMYGQVHKTIIVVVSH